MAHWRAVLFLAFLAAVAVFVVAVYNVPSALELYEKHMKEYMERAEFVFTWIGVSYSVLPMIAFDVVNDWSRVFFDCFHPAALWLDALYSGMVVIQLITFVGRIEWNTGRIAAEYASVALQLSGVNGYVMMKRSANDPTFDHAQARKLNKWALVFLLVFGLPTLYQLQFKHKIPDGYTTLAWCISGLGMCFQALQIFCSLFFRWYRDDFANDEPSTRNVKLGAAVFRMFTFSYDWWSCTSKGYWTLDYGHPFAAMTCVGLAVNCVLALCRYFGPAIIKEKFDALVAPVRTLCTNIKNQFNAKWAAFTQSWNEKWDAFKQSWSEKWAAFSVASLCTWLERRRRAKALAAAEARNAELPFDQHFSSLSIE
ncbi:hypothetical protein ACP70R_021969 [Stipagrostis hirtigluma subsp. patula]